MSVMRIVAAALAVVVLAGQPALFEPPQGYYKARGPRVIATWSVDRVTLPEDASLVATLAIEGATNPTEIVRPDLANMREFADRFQIEPLPTASPGVFVWRLKPRNATVDRLPSLDFFYDSGVKVGNPFKNARVKGIDLVVTAVEKPAAAPIPLLAPERLFAYDSSPMDREPFEAGTPAWLGLFAFGLLVAGGWLLAWRRLYPDGAKLAKLRRNRAMRRATDALRRADSAAAVAAAAIGYIRSRCPLSPGRETPAEVGEALRLAGIDEADATEAFLRRCDAARFSASSDTPMSLAEAARDLLAKLEAAA